MPTEHPPLILGRYPELARAAASRVVEAIRRRGPLGAPVELIVASRAAGEAIMRHVTGELGPVAGIVLRSPESLASDLLARSGRLVRVATRDEQAIAMQLASRESKLELFQTPGIASALRRSYRDIRDAGASLDDLESRMQRTRPADRERVRESLRLFRHYEQLIARAGAVDPSELFTLAAKELKSGTRAGQHLLYGFYDATGVQMLFFNALAMRSAISAVFVPAPSSEALDDAYRFASPFVVAVRTWTGEQLELAGEPAVGWEITTCESVQAEPAIVMAAVRRAIDSAIPASEISIVVRQRDERERARFARAASDYGLSLDTPAARPLHSTPVVRGIRLLLSSAGSRIHRRDVIELLRCGLKVPRRVNVEWLDRMTRQARIGGGTASQLRLIRSDRENVQQAITDLTTVVEHIENLVQKVRKSATGAEWRQLLRSLSDAFALESESDLAAVDALRSIADTLGTIAPDSQVRLPAIDELIRDCGEATGAAQPPGETIWFGDVMRFRGRSASVLFVAGMAADLFPQRRTEDPLLRDSDRTVLGVRQVGDGRDEERLLFEMLCDSAKEIRFSWSRTAADNRGQRPSPLLREFALQRDSANSQLITRRFQEYLDAREAVVEPAGTLTLRAAERILSSPDSGALRQLRSIARAATNGVHDGFVTSSPLLAERVTRTFARIRPTRLEQMGECPHKFFYSALLGLDEIEDPDVELEMEARMKGTVDHAILEDFYKSLPPDEITRAAVGKNAPLPGDLRTRLDAIVDARFNQLDVDEPPNNRLVRSFERDAAKSRLARFLATDLLHMQDSGFMPVEFEYRLDPAAATSKIEASGVEIAVSGIIDRVDRRDETGDIRIVDYKSGAGNRYKKLGGQIAEGRKLQLALYALVVQKVFGVPADRVFGLIRPIAAPDSTDNQFGFNLADLEESLNENLETFVRAAAAGLFPAKPGEECKYCLMTEWCRAKHDDDEIRTASRFESALEMLKESLR